MSKNRKIFFSSLTLSILFLIFCRNLYAEAATQETDLITSLVTFVFQLSIVLFAAKLGGTIFEKLKLPAVLGEIVAGIIIGPYLLGNIPLPGFEKGLFPFHEGFPISIELYSLTTIASIILLFMVGLETNIETLLGFSIDGFVIGLGGVIASFLLGDLTSVLFSKYIFGTHYGFMHPVSLFLGIISTATSVGITARILTERKKMDSPEGVTTIIAAVIDDVLGIIMLAVVIGIAKSGSIAWEKILAIALKAFGFWLGFTALGLYFARYLSEFLKKFKDRSTIAVMSFAMALFLSGIFERSGLAMIIGAYVIGLSLSKTDLSLVIRENLTVLYRFFVPLFFCVMGMLVNFREILSPKVMIFGIIYVVLASFGKIIGCGIPALFSGFNLRGAMRIGVGMVPRGEVALIIAGIGLSSGILYGEIFSVAIFMTFITTMVTPPILDRMLRSNGGVLRKERHVKIEHKEIIFQMPNPETAELILSKAISSFENEGFYVHLVNLDEGIYQVLKGQSFITMKFSSDKIVFDCLSKDMAFIYTLFYEVLAGIEHLIRQLENLSDKFEVDKKTFFKEDALSFKKPGALKFISPIAVEVNLKGNSKKDIIEEMVDVLIRSGQLKHSKREKAIEDLLKRENTMSTGMEEGIALPHAKTDTVSKLSYAIGLKKDGIDFESIDGKPSRIIVIVLSPKWAQESYLQFIAEISKALISKESYDTLLSCRNNRQLYSEIVSLA